MPRSLREYLGNHEVTTADEAGWAELTNGDLLRSAEDEGYQVFVSADKNLSYQQNLSNRRLAMVILSSNHWPTIRSAAPEIVAAIQRSQAGSFTSVDISRPHKSSIES